MLTWYAEKYSPLPAATNLCTRLGRFAAWGAGSEVPLGPERIAPLKLSFELGTYTPQGVAPY
jgi:hypothetical protein